MSYSSLYPRLACYVLVMILALSSAAGFSTSICPMASEMHCEDMASNSADTQMLCCKADLCTLCQTAVAHCEPMPARTVYTFKNSYVAFHDKSQSVDHELTVPPPKLA